MKKSLVILLFLAAGIMAATSPNAVQLTFQNMDAEDRTFEVMIDDAKQQVTFPKGGEGAVTIEGTAEVATIYTECDEVQVKNGDKIVIQDNCVKVGE
ncbi:MAG: hypothetical protein ACFB0B_00675 [Thermonemataceae bacterium]